MTNGGEKVFLEENRITVTQTRFVVDGDTFAMSTVSSVRTRHTDETDGGKKFLRNLAIGASVLIGIAIALSVDPIVGAIVGVGGLIASLIFIRTSYQIYHLFLGTNSGEEQALSSRDIDYIQRVEGALNEAIVARG